jgi:hypothetical protein
MWGNQAHGICVQLWFSLKRTSYACGIYFIYSTLVGVERVLQEPNFLAILQIPVYLRYEKFGDSPVPPQAKVQMTTYTKIF